MYGREVDAVELHDRCVGVFLSTVRRVADGQWHRPTPCSEWDVRALVNHMVYEQRWTVPLMAGETIASVGGRFDGDLLGADPRATVARTATEAQAAVAPAVRSRRIAHLSFGDTPAEEYARQLAADHLIHSWDLAVAIGVPAAPAGLPRDLAEEVAGWFAGTMEDAYRSGGWIAPRPPGVQTADVQGALLVAFGRDPGWKAPV